MKVTEHGFPHRAGTGEMKNNLFEKQSHTPAPHATTEILLLCVWHLSENKMGGKKSSIFKGQIILPRLFMASLLLKCLFEFIYLDGF